jgi:hypothetical protein
MASVTLDLSAWVDFKRDLATYLESGMPDALIAGGERAGAKLDELVRTTLPPPKQSSTPSPIHTAKQRRWWWATMHAKARGDSRALPGWKAVYKRIDGVKTLVISGGYKRTGKLMQSMTWEVRTQGLNVTVLYGTNRAYGAYVVGDPNDPDTRRRQALIHQSNWTPLVMIARQNVDVLAEAVIDGAYPVIRKHLSGG